MFKPIPNFEDYSINKKGIVRNCRGKLISHQTSKGCSTHFVSLYDKNGNLIPMTVKVGDKVLVAKYSGTDVKLDGEEYSIVSLSDILAIVE